MNFVSCTSDGVADVTGCLQAEIDGTKPGETLYFIFPTVVGGSYRISAPLVITKPIIILGDKYTTIRQATPGKGIFQIESSNVVIRNLNLQGPQYTTQNVNEVAISVIGPSASSPLTGIKIGDCMIENFGMYGILMKYVKKFKIHDCEISKINYGGIMGLSVIDGRVVDNDINNIVATPNAYGIAMTRITTSSGELTTNPRSDNILISGNHVSNVTNWEGIDTHAGSKIVITNNEVYGCARAISIVDCPNSANVPTYGPKDCIVSDNILDSGKTDGTAVYGVTVSGCSKNVTGSGATVAFTVFGGAISAITPTPVASGSGYPVSSTFNLLVTGGNGVDGIIQATTDSSGTVTSFAATPVIGGWGYVAATGAATSGAMVPVDLAEGCVVSNNTIRGYGQQSNSIGMAIYLVNTRGLSLTGNTIIEPGKCGIGLYYCNYGFTITGNTVQSPWSLTQQAVAISAISDWNRGFIGNNSYVLGSKVATHVLEIGLNIGNFANSWINVTKDYADSSIPLYDPGHRTH